MIKCLHVETNVGQTWKHDDGMFTRRRKCKDCGALLYTTEVVTSIIIKGKTSRIPNHYEPMPVDLPTEKG